MREVQQHLGDVAAGQVGDPRLHVGGDSDRVAEAVEREEYFEHLAQHLVDHVL